MKNELPVPLLVQTSFQSTELFRLWVTAPDEGNILISLRTLDHDPETYVGMFLEAARQIAEKYAKKRNLDTAAVHSRILAALAAELSFPTGGQPEGELQ